MGDRFKDFNLAVGAPDGERSEPRQVLRAANADGGLGPAEDGVPDLPASADQPWTVARAQILDTPATDIGGVASSLTARARASIISRRTSARGSREEEDIRALVRPDAHTTDVLDAFAALRDRHCAWRAVIVMLRGHGATPETSPTPGSSWYLPLISGSMMCAGTTERARCASGVDRVVISDC